MKKKTFIFIMLGALLSLAGCKKEISYPEEAVAVSIPEQEFYTEGGTFTVLVKTNVVLDVEISESWVQCTENPTAPQTKAAVAAANQAFVFNVDAWDAKGDKTRTADVRLTGENVAPVEFTVVQKTGEVFSLISVDPANGSISNEGGQISVQLNTNVEYEISLTGDDTTWLTPDENNSSTGSIIRYTAAPNESFDSRSAVLTLSAEGFESIVVELTQLSQVRGISTAADLVAFSAEWKENGSKGDYSKWVSEEGGNVIILADDIDMSGITDWQPIADFKDNGKIELNNVKMSYSNCQTFLNYTFDGQGYSIKNWNIDIQKDEVPSAGMMYGLFGVGSGITIRNVNIDESCTLTVDIKNAKGAVVIAPVIACCNNCIIENCTSALQVKSVNVETSSETSPMVIISGCVGYFKTNNQNRTKWVKNCTFNGKAENVTTSTVFSSSTPSVLSGVVGWVFGQTKGASEALIQNCVNNGSLSAQFLRVGGVIGTASQDAIIHDCVNNGTVELHSFEGCTITTCYAGGVIAFESCQVADSYPEMDGCSNTGTVVGYGNFVTVGGMAGCTKNTSLKNCSNSGLVVCTSTADPKYHGLLVGCLNPTTNTDRPQPSYENIKIGGRYAAGYSAGVVSDETTVTEDNYFALAAFERSSWPSNSKWNTSNVTFIK